MYDRRSRSLKRETLALCVQPHGDRSAGCKPCRNAIVGGKTTSETANARRLVSDKAMCAAAHRKLEDFFASLLRGAALGIFDLGQISDQFRKIASCPCRDHCGGIISVGATRQQVIRIVE